MWNPIKALWALLDRWPLDSRPAESVETMKPAKVEPARPTKPNPAIRRKRRLAVCVGISRYINSPENTLPNARNDGVSWERELKRRGWTVLRLLLDYDATKGAILDALGELCYEIGPEDAGLLTLAGHGVPVPHPNEPDGKVEAFCPSDLMLDYPRNALTAYDVAERARTIGAGGLLAIFADCCYPTPKDPERLRALRMSLRQPPIRSFTLPASLLTHPSPGAVRSFQDHMREVVPAAWEHTIMIGAARWDQPSSDGSGDNGAATEAGLLSLDAGSFAGIHAAMTRRMRGRYEQIPCLVGSPANVKEVLF